MDLKKILILLAGAFLAYKFLYRTPEVDYGQYSGVENSAPSLGGGELVGHLKIYLARQSYSAGHGFVLRHESQYYVVSASHVVSDLKSVDSVDIISGTETLLSNAQPALGASYSTCNMDDARRDASFYTIDNVPAGAEISMAAAPPRAGQNVWLMCTQNSGAQKIALIPARVTASSNRALKYNFLERVAFQGTSGCPVIDSNKRLVGVNVCGHQDAGVAVPIPTLLDSLDAL